MDSTLHSRQPGRPARFGASACLALCLTWLSTSVWALDARYSGSWYDPAKDGQGFVVQVLDGNSALVTWFTFDTEGQQAWMQAVGRIEGQRMVFDELLRFTGPSFGDAYDPADRQAIASGRLEIEFDDCHGGQARYEGAGGFPDDTLALTRLTSVAGFGCDGPGKDQRFPLHHGISGAWYAPAQDGQGWMVEVLSEHEALVYWFTYDRDGQQRWMLGIGPIRNERIEVRDLQWAEGGRFGADFDPAEVTRKSWGRVNLKLWPCQGAEVTYIEGSAHLGRRGDFTGVVPLVSIDGLESCPPYVDKWTAARLLDQAAFGPTPDDEKRVYRLGIEGWIDEQLAMPASQIEWEDLKCQGNFFDHDFMHYTVEDGVDTHFHGAAALRIMDKFVGGADQLRLRMSWALSQLLVISAEGGIQEVGQAVYFNMLQDHALGNFRDLLRAVTLSPVMGLYLDNAGSRAASDRCPNCIPNENYARELLMLFTIGVNQLNMDGTVKVDSDGMPVESFTQHDVMELARAISGWHLVDQIETEDRMDFYWEEQACFAKGGGNGFTAANEYPMRPIGFGAHDAGSKQLLGHSIPAGQGIHADLESVLDILINHPNMAPFVSQRLIRHFTTSNPSPAYIERVARVFADNGEGVAGDLSAVIKAILLDPEARLGDEPEKMPRNFGRIRDLVHQRTAIARGLECTALPVRSYWGTPMDNRSYGMRSMPHLPRNTPLSAPEVFNFYPPDNKVPGMDIISPEHLLLNFSGVQARVWALAGDRRELKEFCNYDVLRSAIMTGPDATINLMKDRYLRGRDSFPHEVFMHDYADGLRQWLINSENSSEDTARYEGYQLSMFFGYTLLGEEFGVVR